MIDFAVIFWDVTPELFRIGPFAPRWYGLMFAGGFLVAYRILLGIYEREGKPDLEVYKIFIYAFVGTLVGARLGHVLFYNPGYYLPNPLEIFKIWEGGLASHGGAIGVITALYLYQRKRKKESFLWILDRAAIVSALTGAFIRLGNLFNSEILGTPSDLPWAFVFERVDNIPRHPAQLYEALCYLAIFFVLRRIHKLKAPDIPNGRLFGIMLVGIFGARFLVEFIKEVQEPFEANLPLDMGQLLSIPMVLLGLWLWRRSHKPGVSTE